MFRGPTHEVLGGEHVGTLGTVGLQATLVADGEILILGQYLHHPLMARASLQAPEFVFVDKGDAKAFTCTDSLHD